MAGPRADGKMIFGHNTNVNVDGTVYHVQTEEHGAANALIDTTVYCSGRVLHRRTNNYFDLPAPNRHSSSKPETEPRRRTCDFNCGPSRAHGRAKRQR